MSRLAEIYKQESKTGGGVTSTLGKRLSEKIDPRQMFDRSGLIATMFPSLKSYSATKPSADNSLNSKIESTPQLNSGALVDVATATKMTAKNTMILPAMARDMNLMRQNIAKVVKLQGGTAATKGDMFFMRAKERESIFESAFSKLRGKSGSVGLPGLLGRTKRDGQSKSTALYVETVGMSDTLLGALGGAAAGAVGGKLSGALAKALPFLASATLPVLGIAGLAGLLYFLIKKDSGEAQTVGEMEKGGGYTPEQRAVAAPEVPQASEEELRKVRESMRTSEDPTVRAAAAELDRRDTVSALPDESEAEKRRLGLSTFTPLPTAPTPAITPTSETLPSNTVVSGSGEAIRTGSGGYVTSGEPSAPPSPSPAAPTESATQAPSKVTPVANIPSAPGLPIDYKSYAEKIGQKESGGNYRAVNTLGYLGKYQFGAMALQDMGLVKKGTTLKGLDSPENWNIAGGKQSFLNNAQLQEDTMVKYTRQNYSTLNRIGVINKDSSPQEVAGYLAASHLLGPGGAKQLAQGNVSADAYGTTSASYYKVGLATQGVTSGTVVSSVPATPTSGMAVASTSSSVADGQRAAMTSTSGTTIIDNSQKSTVASSGGAGKAASAYDRDIVEALVASSYA